MIMENTYFGGEMIAFTRTFSIAGIVFEKCYCVSWKFGYAMNVEAWVTGGEQWVGKGMGSGSEPSLERLDWADEVVGKDISKSILPRA